MDFSYSAEIGRPRLDRPERFMHFQVVERDEPLPPRLRPAKLGGKAGLLAAPSSHGYAGETYFANHLRFFWTERRIKYAATLHNFGPDTRRLLEALVARLRPADALLPPRRASASGRVKPTGLPVGGPTSVAVSHGYVWVAAQGDHRVDRGTSLLRIDPDSQRTIGDPIRISRFFSPVALAVNGSVWVAQDAVQRQVALRRFDPRTGRLVGAVKAQPDFVAVALARGSIWALNFGGWPGARSYRGGTVDRVATGNNRILGKTRVGRAPAGIAVGEGAVWVTNNLDDNVSRIDRRTNRVIETIRVGDSPTGIAVGEGAVWVANNGDHTVSRIDPTNAEVVKTIRVGRHPRGIAVGESAIWVANELDDTVSRIDPRTNLVAETIRVGAGPVSIAVGEGAVWVANNQDKSVSRIEP